MTMPEQTVVWGQHAKQWSLLGSPLKPTLEDAELALAALQPLFDSPSAPCRIAVLGVTRELLQLPWPSTVVLDAFDHSADMIAKLWQPHPQVVSSVHQADWRSLPLQTGSVHAVVGDGSLNALPVMEQYTAVLQELHRILVVGGRCVIRCYVRPDVSETMERVVLAASEGQVGSVHALKWRIAMALAGRFGPSVAVSDIHAAFEASFPSRDELAASAAWPREVIDTIDAYRASPTRYTFPSLIELRERSRPWFEIESITCGSYELADRCPTVCLVRKDVEVAHE